MEYVSGTRLDKIWDLDETKQLTVEYTDLIEVGLYDARRKFIDIQAEDKRIVNDLQLKLDQTVN